LNVLYLTSDWKWTGPAEPMLLALQALRERGHRVELAAPEAPSGERGLLSEAAARGVAPSLVVERARGIRPWRDLRDARRLRRHAADVDVLHVWHSRAHGLALRARARDTALVRAHSDGLAPGLGERFLFARGCDALVCTSEACAERHELRAHAVAGAVDLVRFRPAADAAEVRAGREQLGVDPGAPLIGVVARVQARRRFDLLFDALDRLRTRHPRVRLALIGRGTQIESVARRPAADRGLAEHVILAGQLEGEAYASSLRALDVLCFLVPGSDAGCRALQEAAASGVPAVASRRGALPELVADGETGLLVDERPDALSAALDHLLSAEEPRVRMGEAARRRAEARFAPERLALELEQLYAGLLRGSNAASRAHPSESLSDCSDTSSR